MSASGCFRHDQEILVGPRSREGSVGYHVITPLERENGSKILVNRGWIPRERKDQMTRAKGLPTSVQNVEGLIRLQEKVGGLSHRISWLITIEKQLYTG